MLHLYNFRFLESVDLWRHLTFIQSFFASNIFQLFFFALCKTCFCTSGFLFLNYSAIQKLSHLGTPASKLLRPHSSSKINGTCLTNNSIQYIWYKHPICRISAFSMSSGRKAISNLRLPDWGQRRRRHFLPIFASHQRRTSVFHSPRRDATAGKCYL